MMLATIPSQNGQWYDWVMVQFKSEATIDGDSNYNSGNESEVYPAKVLALYEDADAALVHSTTYKTATNREGLYGDSQLAKHYRVEFHKAAVSQSCIQFHSKTSLIAS
jgi:hypothetical protein